MNHLKNNFLKGIYEDFYMNHTVVTDEEKEITTKIVEHEKALVSTLNEKQKQLFKEFDDAVSELNYTCCEQAFIRGIKFATSYLTEAIEK